MSGEDGINVILKVGANTLGGQVSTSLNLQTAMADTTSKDDAGWQSMIPTTRSGDVSVSGILDTSDTAYEALRAAWVAGTDSWSLRSATGTWSVAAGRLRACRSTGRWTAICGRDRLPRGPAAPRYGGRPCSRRSLQEDGPAVLL